MNFSLRAVQRLSALSIGATICADGEARDRALTVIKGAAPDAVGVGNGPVIGDLAGYSTLLAARATQSSPGMGRLWTIEAEFAVTGQ